MTETRTSVVVNASAQLALQLYRDAQEWLAKGDDRAYQATMLAYRNLLERSGVSDPDAEAEQVIAVAPAEWAAVQAAGAVWHLADVRSRRNMLLAESDWTQMPDAPVTDGMRAAWAAYRQQLRDLPDTLAPNQLEPDWPTPPA